jgi:5-methylcytosine-specific restriction endonuclease McrA
MEARILRLNMAGQPLAWMPWQEAATLLVREQVGWTLGAVIKQVRGGYSRRLGSQSLLELPAIMACDGHSHKTGRLRPPLTNRALFLRDNHQCLYCGQHFSAKELSRDHVVPSSRGGLNRWENVVAACKRCNHYKGNRLLTEIGLELLALPYCPNAYEYLALINSDRIQGDQLAYLQPQFKSYQAPLPRRA